MEHLENTITEISRISRIPEATGNAASPAPTTRPPLLIGGDGKRVLTLAGRYADIVGFSGLSQATNQPPGTFRLVDADGLAKRVEFFRNAAGDRRADVESNILIQQVVATDDRRAEARRWLRRAPYLSVEQMLAAPQVLLRNWPSRYANTENGSADKSTALRSRVSHRGRVT